MFNSCQYVPVNLWGEGTTMISVNRGQSPLRCALHSAETSSLLVFATSDSDPKANTEEDIQLIVDYFDDKDITQIITGKDDTNLVVNLLGKLLTIDSTEAIVGKSRKTNYQSTKTEPSFSMYYLDGAKNLKSPPPIPGITSKLATNEDLNKYVLPRIRT